MITASPPQPAPKPQVRQTQPLIDGRWTTAQSGKIFTMINPAAEEVIAQVAEGYAAVWTRDIARAHDVARKLWAGTARVNWYHVFDAAAPFGGCKRSGFGREPGERGLDPYLETKTVTVSLE